MSIDMPTPDEVPDPAPDFDDDSYGDEVPLPDPDPPDGDDEPSQPGRIETGDNVTDI